MHKSVVMALAMSAGLASGAFGQNYTYESRLVLDNDPLLAQIGVNYGTRALLPGASATAVGVTLLVRVTSQGTVPNYGVSSVSNGGTPSKGVSRFTHNDAVSNQTNALWSSPSLAFARGYIDATSNQRGAMNTGVSFRRGIDLFSTSTLLAMNSERDNPATTIQPIDGRTNGPSGPFPIAGATVNSYSTGSLNANGWIGPIGAVGTPGQIAGLFLTAGSGTGGIDYSNNDQDAIRPGVQAPWEALYHLVFVPRTAAGAADPIRDVTVSFRGYVRAAISSNFNSSPSMTTIPMIELNPSVTFTVPAPFTCVALALASLAAGRRPRSRG